MARTWTVGQARDRCVNLPVARATQQRGFWMLYALEHEGRTTYIGATSAPRGRIRVHMKRGLLRPTGLMRALVVGPKVYIRSLERAAIARYRELGEPLENKYN